MDEFRRDDLVFDVTDAGPPDGDVVVLLHGFPENRRCWDRLVPLLTGAGYRVLAPDQRGYSPRARPPRRRDYRMPELVADTLALVDAAGAGRVHLVGHDWGGAVAWAFATAHPDRLHSVTSLTVPHPAAMLQAMLRSDQLLRSSYMLWFQLPALPEAAFRPPLDALTRRSLERTGLPADAAARYVAFLAEPGAARAALNWYRAIPFSPPLPGPVRVPTLYVHAGADPFLGPDAARRTGWQVHAPYRFVRLAGASHWLPEENAGDIAALLLEHFGDATR